MKALLLTAGLATRFRPHTLKVPKPLLPFWGIPQYLYGYELLKTLGASEFIFNQHHLPRELKQGILKYAEKDVPLHFSDETTGILGSAGAIKKAESILSVNGDFILYNGDEVFFPEPGQIEEALRLHRQENRLATIIVMKHPEAGNKFGAVWTDPSQKILGFGKSAIAGASPKHYIGMMILNSRVISRIPLKETNILYDTLLPLLNNEAISAHEISCHWFETGNEKDFIDAHLEVLRDLDTLARNPHFKMMIKKYLGATPNDFKKSPMVYSQGSTSIASDAKLKGFVWLQDGAQVSAGASLHNCMIGPNVSIEPKQNFENKLIL